MSCFRYTVPHTALPCPLPYHCTCCFSLFGTFGKLLFILLNPPPTLPCLSSEVYLPGKHESSLLHSFFLIPLRITSHPFLCMMGLPLKSLVCWDLVPALLRAPRDWLGPQHEATSKHGCGMNLGMRGWVGLCNLSKHLATGPGRKLTSRVPLGWQLSINTF